MIKQIKKLLPMTFKQKVRNFIKYIKYNYRKFIIQRAVKRNETMKIIVGAAETYQVGWYSTNEQWLDITKIENWENVFNNKTCITHIVAEHVFEHLTYAESQKALKCIYQYLMNDGRIRIAVPDGYNPNPIYLKNVGINGIGDDAADHKQLLNIDFLSALMEEAGFAAIHIEGYTKNGTLIQNPYNPQDGFIMRSRANDNQNNNIPWDFPDAHTSLIVDGIKSSSTMK